MKAAGEVMHQAALEFSRNTLESEHREAMVAASQQLLTSVAKLLVVVDAVDIKKMFKTSSQVRKAVCLPTHLPAYLPGR